MFVIYCMLFILFVGILSVLFISYQLVRINVAYKIMKKWIDDMDQRAFKYDYLKMCDLSKENLYGFRYPRESYYK